MQRGFRILHRLLTISIISSIILGTAIIAGCQRGPGKPTFISFTGKGKGQESVEKMKPIISKLKKKYQGKVIFREVDIDNPANKKELKKYYVTMNPTYIVLDKEGRIKETFLGAAHEEMLERAITSYISSQPSEKQRGSSIQPLKTPPEHSSEENQTSIPKSP